MNIPDNVKEFIKSKQKEFYGLPQSATDDELNKVKDEELKYFNCSATGEFLI